MAYRKMKPCPKCSRDVARYTYESGWTRVECDGCDYVAMPGGTIPQAIENHNSQVGSPK